MIEIGSVVRLNSGGPEMMVAEIDVDGATCVWGDDDEVLWCETFNLATITEVSNGGRR